jgi:hypothetical protein
VVQGNDFWGNDTNPIPRRGSAPFAGTLRLHHVFGFLRPRTEPVNALQEIPLETQHRNFNFFSLRTSVRPVNVAPCRDEDVIHSSLSTLSRLQ